MTKRAVSGMRPTGSLHLGHYHGVLKNWLELQYRYECFFFVADWHALTTHYADPGIIEQSSMEMVVDWLATGIDSEQSTIFIQSGILEHAELFTLLGMITPLGWLERVPTYKEQQEKLAHLDLNTYGFLGYPLLQAADVLIYHADYVPVGEDQIPHLEFTREVARRFNHLYGKDAYDERKIANALKYLGDKKAVLFHELRQRFQDQGDDEARKSAQALIETTPHLSIGDKERLLGYLEGTGRKILTEPEVLLTPASKMPGLDGRKMSKSYNNTIALRESFDDIAQKIKVMPTDPARKRRSDPGNPEICPVFEWHKVYSDDSTRAWVQQGCISAGIGCLDCKTPIIEAVRHDLEPIQEKISYYENHPGVVRDIIAQGCERARRQARETLREVKEVIRLPQI
jgi:tryptophanyl-tRNA synthetase